MNKRSYEDYIKNECNPVGFNEAVGQYYFGQISVDILLDRIVDLQAKVKELEEQKDLLVKSITRYNSSVILETDNVKIETDEQRYNILVHLINELGKERYENDQLKQQLRELPKKIVEEIIKLTSPGVILTNRELNHDWLEYSEFRRVLGNILTKYKEEL